MEDITDGRGAGKLRLQREKGGEKILIRIGKTARKTGWKKSAGNRKEACGKELQPCRKAGNKAGGKTPETGKKTSSERKTSESGRKAGSGAGKTAQTVKIW